MDAMSINGAWIYTPKIHQDARGSFLEGFRGDELAADVGYRLDVAQANWSVSHRGVVRGVDFAEVPPGQAKYVSCARGAMIDVVVDIRVGSPQFGRWEAVRLDDENRRSVFIAEGLGHAFMALTDRVHRGTCVRRRTRPAANTASIRWIPPWASTGPLT